MPDNALQRGEWVEISISNRQWATFERQFPIGLLEAVLWTAVITAGRAYITWLMENGELPKPDWLPKFGPSLLFGLVMTVFLLLYWKYACQANLRSLGLRLDRLGGDLKFTLVAAVGMGLFYLFAAGVYWLVLQVFFESGDAMFRDHLRGAIFNDATLLYYLGVMLLFPVLEEIWFRGLLYTPMRRELGGRWPAIIILSLLFAFAHSNAVPVNQFIGGMIFAWAYEKRRTLVAPILLHILGNSALAVLGWALVKWQLV
jgi:membrane protease YdiL (CAAX protease family)